MLSATLATIASSLSAHHVVLAAVLTTVAATLAAALATLAALSAAFTAIASSLSAHHVVLAAVLTAVAAALAATLTAVLAAALAAALTALAAALAALLATLHALSALAAALAAGNLAKHSLNTVGQIMQSTTDCTSSGTHNILTKVSKSLQSACRKASSIVQATVGDLSYSANTGSSCISDTTQDGATFTSITTTTLASFTISHFVSTKKRGFFFRRMVKLILPTTFHKIQQIH